MDSINQGSKVGFILTLIGGIIFLIIGLSFFGFIMYKLYTFDWVGGNPDNRLKYLILIFIALYMSVINIWIITSAFWIRKYEKLKLGGWTAWALGLVSFNFLASIGGIFAILTWKKENENDLDAIMSVKSKLQTQSMKDTNIKSTGSSTEARSVSLQGSINTWESQPAPTSEEYY